ncbi:GGDEF domain-containing protein [Motilibacter rhizosphaerae]|uniref:GGDEF domain-containing protein n=1 Tax=Motilibacter rhizosphaerae TaxID=598652 RepID=UPI00102D1D5D|nr:GGDEF domain-containing protein [Motilibacter rhizosphaerae]
MLVLALAPVLYARSGGPAARLVDDLAQLLAALTATVSSARRGLHGEPRARRAWLLLALGTGLWAAGEAYWTWAEVARPGLPFPSWADAGFLLFPPAAAAGLLSWPTASLRGPARWRSLLDGLMVAGSLFVLSWATTLGAIVAGGGRPFPLAVSLAYPVWDVALLSVTLVVVMRTRERARSALALVSAGLAALAFADSAFSYLVALDRYATGSVVDAGWVGGFLLLALAAARGTIGPEVPVAGAPRVVPGSRALFAYVPAVLAVVVCATGDVRDRVDRVVDSATLLVMGVLLVRQLLVVLDNRRLLARLVTAEHELRHRAFHDGLTGLANRALLGDLLHAACDTHRAEGVPVALVYCDLDGFKVVNDELGHDAGDQAICASAERLRAVTRASDTVARVGGDEFAILLQDAASADLVAERIVAAFAQPASVAGAEVRLGASVGVAVVGPDDAPVTPSELLHRADTAMYAAKRAGKGRAVRWPVAHALP